jgi:hypothetical protein
MVLAEHRKHVNLNIFLERAKAYEPTGRSQTEGQAREIDGKIVDLLQKLQDENTGDTFFTFSATPASVPEIAGMAMEMWKEMNTPFGEK